VTDDGGGGTGSSGKGSSVSELGLAVSDDGTFGHLVDGKNISNGEGSFLSSIDKLSSEHSFNSDEVLNSLLVLVRISESDLGERSTSSGVVNDILDDTLDIPLFLRVIESSESSRSYSMSAT